MPPLVSTNNIVNKRINVIILCIKVAYLLCTFSFSTTIPHMDIGLKLTKFNTTFVIGSQGNELYIFENYLGMSAEGIICFFEVLCIRTEFMEIRKYEYTKDMQCVIMSNLAMDIEFLIPIARRIEPIIYLGTKYGPYDYRSPSDTIFGITNREYHWGLGLAYNIKHKCKIVFESQIYSNNKWWWGDLENFDQIQTWGFEKLNLGIRYVLFKF